MKEYLEQYPDRLYFSVGEAAQALDVAPSLIRYWESEFPQLRPKKSRQGKRLFRREDMEMLEVIYQLVKVQGFTLEGARKRLAERPKGEMDRVALIRKLESVKGFLGELKELL